MSDRHRTPEERYAELVEALLSKADVTTGTDGKKGFGASALRLGDKIFAMLSGGRLVVKLPQRRVDAFVIAGVGERFDPRRNGRLMKEWLAVNPTVEEEWLLLATEAMEFVASKH